MKRTPPSVPILLVDDDANHLKILKGLLMRIGFDSRAASDVDSAVRIIKECPLSLLITDLVMPGRSGLDLLTLCREHQPAVPVILISGHGDIETAVSAMKQGAHDFITKPIDEAELENVVRKALAVFEKNSDLVSTFFDAEHRSFSEVVGTSEAVVRLLETVKKIAPTDSTVLISGETGVGKEMIVKAIHAASPRHGRPLVKVNCAAIPETLAESELFGYERGAFTGATTSKPGRFELAHEGTLFLDEIGEMPLQLQTKLLTVLQDKSFERVGGVTTVKVDVRVVAATNRDLRAEIKSGRFRNDLFYRLNVVPLSIPPLRERREDVVPLLSFFLTKSRLRLRKQALRFQPEVTAAMLQYDWPGNIRELENVVERMVLMSDSEVIGLDLLPEEVLGDAVAIRHAATFKEKRESILGVSEQRMIAEALEKVGQNRTKAAELLGISRRTLQNKLRAYGL